MPEILWINHASFVLRHEGVALVCDPWLEGTAFDDGWSLLSPTRFTFEDFEGVTHIWFSHEHPDHFSPPNIMRIPEEVRRQITVLYQATSDGKVAAFCRKAGFQVVEMPAGQWMQIDGDVSALCQPHKDGDSMLAIRTADHTILNLNDCIVRKRKVAEKIKAMIGAVDVLLTQFSYANWEGNPEDVARRERSAAEKLQRMKIQIDTLEPRIVIPFASFVWFSHEENAYMNDAANRIDTAAAFVASQTVVECVVLYPGDRWTIGTPHDNAASLRAYSADYEAPRELTHSSGVPLSDLIAMAGDFLEKMKRENTIALRWLLKPARIFLTDRDKALTLSFDDGLVVSDLDREECDIALSSAALAYCLRHPWGGGTLMVNGRFAAPVGGNLNSFKAYAKISERNNHNKPVGFWRALKLRRAAS